MIQKCLHLSSLAEREIFPTQVSDDSSCQGVAQNIDHGPEPVTMETEGRNWGSSAHFMEQFQNEDGKSMEEDWSHNWGHNSDLCLII